MGRVEQARTWPRWTALSVGSSPTSSSWSRLQTRPVSRRTPDSPAPTHGSPRPRTRRERTQPGRSRWRLTSTPGTTPPPKLWTPAWSRPDHAAVIVRATSQLPDGVTAEQRQVVETELVAKAGRFNPDQLRRIARRAIEAVEPDQNIVDAHENELIRSEEQAAREKCSLTLHDNGDGTTTGHFTIPALAAAMLGKSHRRDDCAPTDAQRGTGPILRLAPPPRTRVRRAARAPAHRPPAQQDRSNSRRIHRPHRPGWRTQGRPPGHRPGSLGW